MKIKVIILSFVILITLLSGCKKEPIEPVSSAPESMSSTPDSISSAPQSSSSSESIEESYSIENIINFDITKEDVEFSTKKWQTFLRYADTENDKYVFFSKSSDVYGKSYFIRKDKVSGEEKTIDFKSDFGGISEIIDGYIYYIGYNDQRAEQQVIFKKYNIEDETIKSFKLSDKNGVPISDIRADIDTYKMRTFFRDGMIFIDTQYGSYVKDIAYVTDMDFRVINVMDDKNGVVPYGDEIIYFQNSDKKLYSYSLETDKTKPIGIFNDWDRAYVSDVSTNSSLMLIRSVGKIEDFYYSLKTKKLFKGHLNARMIRVKEDGIYYKIYDKGPITADVEDEDYEYIFVRYGSSEVEYVEYDDIGFDL